MAKRKQKRSLRNVVIAIFCVLLGIFFLYLFMSQNQSPKELESESPLSAYPKQIVSLYNGEGIFEKLPYKKRQISPSALNTGFHERYNTTAPAKFSKLAQDELSGKNNLIEMKCMPEQIYLNRDDIPYSFIEPSGNYKKVNLKDKEVLSVLSKLENSVGPKNTISQFIVCKTSDDRYLIKYNPILKGGEINGFNDPYNIQAFFAQILKNGQVQELAYIPLKFNAFCRLPVQLTTDGQFYFACDAYKGNSKLEASYASYLYRINLNTLTYSLISSCEILLGKHSCN